MDLDCVICNQLFIPELSPPFTAYPKKQNACIFCYIAIFRNNGRNFILKVSVNCAIK